jgi:glycosyltransferase involved in cell wall biosynthesis
MRIVQVIDSLETGGAERMAVNYANALSKRIEFSGLVPTRAEGSLKNQVEPGVNYFFLKKHYTLDFGAVKRMKQYCKQNRIDFIHAHSTSYFLAIMVKCLYPKVKIIWHDHNGNSEFLEVREAVPLNVASIFFKGIIVVNNQLKAWALRELHCRNVLYIANFTHQEIDGNQLTKLKGNSGKKILLLANLREQKDHFLLLDVAAMLMETHPDWTFHLVGKDFEDDYSRKVKDSVVTRNLENHVFIYGSRTDTGNIIAQCDIALLTSKSEGLPVALLEYGLYQKPVVVTNVGEIPLIVQNKRNGTIVPAGDSVAFYNALRQMILDEHFRGQMGSALYQTILDNHSEDAAMNQYLAWIKNITDGKKG